MSKHTNATPVCASCEEKLAQAHPTLADWFRNSVKRDHPDCHISWSYRGQADQEKAFVEGKTKLHFPFSAHNKCDDQGNPCALALDLFEIDYNGMACWIYGYMRVIADEAAKSGADILWGGTFKHLGDFDHFELRKVSDAG